MITRTRASVLTLAVTIIGGCTSTPVPVEPPPLVDMEEPLALFDEPSDERARWAMPAGTFSGLYLKDARDTLEAMLETPEGLEIVEIVENSPADAAGLQVGDIVLEATTGGDEPQTLSWPAQWRSIELEASPGALVEIVYDRAGAEDVAELTLVPRVRPADREPAERFREEKRVGLVVRNATEVEARDAGLGPGAGAVVVGLSRASPWRDADITYGDLIVAADGHEVQHPQVLLDSIRATPRRGVVQLVVMRDGERLEIAAPVTSRRMEVRQFSIPILVNYEKDEERETFTLLLGLYEKITTAASWRTRFLWIITSEGGDSDELMEVEQ